MARRDVARLIAAAGFSVTSGLALAQQPAQQNGGQQNTTVGVTGWRIECGNSGQALDCRTFIEAVDPGKHQVISSITVRYAADTKKTAVIVQLPLGILVSQPATIAVDNDKPQSLPIETCTPAGCFAGSPTSDALLAKMRAGKDIKLVFYNVAKNPISITMSLGGFALAFDKIKG